MRYVSHTLTAAKSELSTSLDECELSIGERQRVSNAIAKFTAAAVREDRVHRHTVDALAKLADVSFIGRSA